MFKIVLFFIFWKLQWINFYGTDRYDMRYGGMRLILKTVNIFEWCGSRFMSGYFWYIIRKL